MSEKPKRPRARARPYRYYVGKGNNPDLIREIMGTRDWWEEVASEELEHTPYNFKWKQLNYRKSELEALGSVKGIRQCANHFENNMEMCAKSGLFRNISYFYEKVLLQDVFKVIPVTFNFSSLRDPEYATFVETWNICEQHRKADLGEPLDQTDTPPVTDMANAPGATEQQNRAGPPPRGGKALNPPEEESEKKPVARMNYKFSSRVVEKSNALRNTWILKPGTGTNRGIGIKVFHELADLEEHIGKWNKSKCFNWIVQKYMERPMLINERKFDIRAYSLVTSNLDLYYYNEGYLRTSGVAYDLDNLEDKNIHLTNWAVQKKAEGYGSEQDANQMNFNQFQDFLDEHHPGVSVEDDFKSKMKELILHVFVATMGTLNLNNFKHCIELFGYDFMIDTQYRVCLIEVNNNPCLCTPGDATGELIPAMLEDIMKLAIDPIFPAAGDPLGRNKPKVDKTNFLLLHSSSSKATMEMREKWRQNVKDQRREEKEVDKNSGSPSKIKDSKPRLPRPPRGSVVGGEPKSHRSGGGLLPAASPLSPLEDEFESEQVPYEEQEVRSARSTISLPPPSARSADTDSSAAPCDGGKDADDFEPHAADSEVAGKSSEKKLLSREPLSRRLTAVPQEHVRKQDGFAPVGGLRSPGSRQRERDQQAWQRLNMQGVPHSALLDQPSSQHVELLAMHRHFKTKEVDKARRKRFTVGMTQPQLARRGASDGGHLPGIGSPPGSHRRRGDTPSSDKSNVNSSSPNWMVREAAAEAEEVARQLREAGMVNEAAQLERLRVELLQPGTDLTAKKNEARLLAERLRSQARERQTGVAGLGGSEMLMARGGSNCSKYESFRHPIAR